MDMEYIDPYRRRRFPGLAMQQPPQQQQQQQQQQQRQQQQHFPAHQQPHAQSAAAQYPSQYWNPLMAYYQQQHRAAAMMSQGNMHLSKPAEPKPRLAKDEVELLEREFAKNQKPSSSTKRELAEQMGVEVPRINNWFQNRRAKEKQMKKTAEFEAQQAREGAASEVQSITSDQEQDASSTNSEQCYDSDRPQYQSRVFESESQTPESDGGPVKSEPADLTPQTAPPLVASAGQSPASSDSDSYIHIGYESAAAAAARLTEFQQQPTAFPFRLGDTTTPDGVPRLAISGVNPHDGMPINDTGSFIPFADHDYFTTPSAPQFPSEMVAANTALSADRHLLRHQVSVESFATSDAVSPSSIPESPSTVANLRFMSPPPPADIAGRRKSRRPAPLGLSALRGGPGGPKTGIELPRRADTVSPLRRISSATGLCGRVQKAFMGPNGPRSPFAMDRNKEALLQTLQETQTSTMPTLNSGMPPMSPEAMISTSMGECTAGSSSSEDEQGYPFGSLCALGRVPMYNHHSAESAIKSPPGTPGLQMGFHEASSSYFPSSLEQAWSYVPLDEPLPTPSLCSHGGSELEFSMAPQLPGYVASQPATPSFPPTMGPAYAGFFGASLGQTEYHFPDSYPAGSSARSSPVAAPRSKQFQFAQNVTPQDFSTDKP